MAQIVMYSGTYDALRILEYNRACNNGDITNPIIEEVENKGIRVRKYDSSTYCTSIIFDYNDKLESIENYSDFLNYLGKFKK